MVKFILILVMSNRALRVNIWSLKTAMIQIFEGKFISNMAFLLLNKMESSGKIIKDKN